ncbi:hypothetical protein C8Q78DRAFT_239720 [Trametes maxima]|nr:hypothetical protein C8Q78DRAFT_239720 [Trametes maxima]
MCRFLAFYGLLFVNGPICSRRATSFGLVTIMSIRFCCTASVQLVYIQFGTSLNVLPLSISMSSNLLILVFSAGSRRPLRGQPESSEGAVVFIRMFLDAVVVWYQ